MKTITVNASKNYNITIAADILDNAGSIIRKTTGSQMAAVVTDDIVDGLYGKRLTDTLENNGYSVSRYVLPNGESSKNAETFLSILNFLADEKLSRSDVVIALGGGVVGDITGFAAACYMRGTKFVQIPTTLLAMVDSSVGGKTAINLIAGKNLAGVFYQPDTVICDVSLLSSLTVETWRDGYAEVIKYGVIADHALFNSLKTPACLKIEDVIARCVEIKRDIVAKDEFEKSSRKVLNFGHTIGHAIELLSDYNISHGHAIAAGMAIVTRAAVRMGMCGTSSANDIIQILRHNELPINTQYEANRLTDACLSDKKRDGDSLTMVFPIEIGKCILKKIPVSELDALIRLGLEDI